jgi:hypothetical protein
MYSETFQKGEVLPVFGLTGVSEEGVRIPIRATDLNFDFWEYLRGPIDAATGGNGRALRAFISPFAQRSSIRLQSVQLVRTPYVLSGNGVERRADEVVTTFDWKTNQ